MKTTFLLPHYPSVPSGGFRVVYEYANQLIKKGHEVNIIHAKKLRQDKEISQNLIQTMYNKIGSLKGALVKPKINWQYVDTRINIFYVPDIIPKYIPNADIIFATAWQTAEYVWEYPQNKGRKFYLIQHYETWNGPKERVDATWHFPMHKVVISKWLYELGLSIGVQASEIYHIPNGIDHTKFYLINDIKNRPKRIAMLCSNVEWKGSADGIRALEIVKGKYPDLNAVLFGVRQRPNNLPSWIEHIQDPPQEKLVRDIYNSSCIYLCPSWMEGWHLPPAEAMACGCAVVSTDIGGVRDYAINGKTALLSKIKNSEFLADNLLKLLNDDYLRYKLANDGHSYIQQFTWDHSAGLLEKYLCET